MIFLFAEDSRHYHWGVLRAADYSGAIKITSASGEDVTAEFRCTYPDGPQAFDAIVREAELELNRKMIDGPTSEEESEFRELGWNPRAILEGYERKAEEELLQVRRFDEEPRWRRGRIRDMISARQTLLEINTVLKRGCSERGIISLQDIFPEIEKTRRAFNSMPSFDVSVTLKTSLHRNAKHKWKTNDVHDINALASTIPYCDVVVTDKAMSAHVMQTGLAKRMNSIILKSLLDLPNHL